MEKIPEKIPPFDRDCLACGNTGFSGQGTGYGDVCPVCGGQSFVPSEDRMRACVWDEAANDYLPVKQSDIRYIPYAKGGLNDCEYLNVLRQCEMIVHAWDHIKNTLSDRLCKYYVKADGTEEEHALASIYERMDELDGELTANDLDLLMNRIKFFTKAEK